MLRSSDGGMTVTGWGGLAQERTGTGGLRWGREGRHSGVPGWDLVCFALLRRYADGGGVGRSTTGYTVKLISASKELM